MAVPIREQILAAICVAVGGEYAQPAPVDVRELPWTGVEDGEEAATDDTYGYSTIVMEVVVGRGDTAPNSDRQALRIQGSRILADIETEMFADPTFGGLVDQLSYAGGVVQTQLGSMCLVAAAFNVQYQRVRGDPFAQD